MTPFDAISSPTWIEIDSAQLATNVRLLERAVDRPVLASVKANGYGHGMEIAAKAFLKGGASYLGVARLVEGILLRQAGITAPILIIGALLPEEMPVATESGLEFFVWTVEHLAVLRDGARVHLKVDTGMGRAGCLPEEVLPLAQKLRDMNGVAFIGLATHFADADSTDSAATEKQIRIFDDVITALNEAQIRPRLVHAANSAGALFYEASRYDMVRMGLAAYGIATSPVVALPEGVKPALTWKARVAAVKTLPEGQGVSYGGTYQTPKQQKIALLPVGYGDGFRRMDGNRILIAGQERAVLGRVCMDHCMVDADGLDVQVGAEVVLIGTQGAHEITATALATRWRTIPYEVLTGLAARLPRCKLPQL